MSWRLRSEVCMGRLVVDTLQGTTAAGNKITASSGHVLVIPGQPLQVLTATSGPAAQTIASTTPVAVTGLSVSITPKNANSTILIQATLNCNLPWVPSLGIFKDGAATVSTSGYTNNNEANMQVTIHDGADVTDRIWTIDVNHVERAASTAARTYQVYATSAWGGSTRNFIINNRSGSDMAGFSYMWVMELAP